MAICRKCGAKIDFIRTVNGKMMPVQPRGTYAVRDKAGRQVITIDGVMVRAVEAYRDDPGAFLARMPHWEFCPGAEEIRQERKAAPPPRPAAPAAPAPQDEQISMNIGGNYGSKTGYWHL